MMRQACSQEKRLKIIESMKQTREKRTRQACRVFTIKIDSSKLTSKQKEQLKMMFVEGKWIKNSRIAWAKENNKSIFECERPKKHEVVKVKNKNGDVEERELKYIGSQMAQGVVDEMKSNLKTIIRLTKTKKQKHGDLKFVSEIKSLNLAQYGLTYKFKSSKRMKIQGVSGYITISGAKQFFGNDDIELASAKILNTPKGYYIAISTFTYFDKLPLKKFNHKNIGLDMGCETSITYSDGSKKTVQIEESGRMKRLQRKFAKQVKGSNNRNRTRKLIQVEYQKLKNKKQDISNKILSELKYYDNVIIQDEQLSKWMKCGHGKKVQHSCLGRIKSKLKTQFDNVICLDKTIPTTKICLNCGKVFNDMKQSHRTFKCDCGVTLDRDVHAAQNMIDIAEMLLGNRLTVPVGRREFKREEFLIAYEKKFKCAYGTLIHEAHPF